MQVPILPQCTDPRNLIEAQRTRTVAGLAWRRLHRLPPDAAAEILEAAAGAAALALVGLDGAAGRPALLSALGLCEGRAALQVAALRREAQRRCDQARYLRRHAPRLPGDGLVAAAAEALGLPEREVREALAATGSWSA